MNLSPYCHTTTNIQSERRKQVDTKVTGIVIGRDTRTMTRKGERERETGLIAVL